MQVSAQGKRDVTSSPARSSATINQVDMQNLPHGLWVITEPEKMGEPSYTEFGKYDHGNRTGVWYKLDSEGDVMSVETFRNNVLDGEAKYFYNGRLTSTGSYRGLNPNRETDTIVVEDPVTGMQSLKAVKNDRYTVKHGTWQFYDSETGRLVREEEYQVDSMIYSKLFPMSAADSAYYKKRTERLPHNRKKIRSSSAAKHTEYIK